MARLRTPGHSAIESMSYLVLAAPWTGTRVITEGTTRPSGTPLVLTERVNETSLEL
jgi:hypothetical protein